MSPDFRDLADDIVEAAISVFSEPVKYLPKSGGQYSLTGIFDNQFQQVDPDTEVVVASNQPMLDLRLEDMSFTPTKGDRVIVRSVAYRVIDSQEDGLAAVKLLLHRIET